MRLTHVHVESFRGIPRLDVDLDRVTVVIGENNHGKTSLFDVLGLCLGPRGSAPDTCFREDDFFRPPGGGPQPIRIVLTFEEDATERGPDSGDELTEALSRDGDGTHRLRAEFTGRPDDGLVQRRFLAEGGEPLVPQPAVSVLARLQGLHPMLLLRFAQPHQESRTVASDTAQGRKEIERRGRRSLEGLIARVYHDLTHKRGPLPTEDIAKGLRAARRLFGGDAGAADDGPMHRMVSELLASSLAGGPSGEGAGGRGRPGSGSHTMGLLLVLGSLLEVRREETLQAEARPIIAIEEPEVHLHPILLASTWDVIEALNAQTVVTTNSGELLSSVPLQYLRRLTRRDDRIDVRQLGEGSLSESDLRRMSYHVRAKRGGVLFARCWLLVEGESEFWLMTQLASVLGYDLEAEGVRAIEFAQCGVSPLVKLANDLGIHWHLLADGDESGTAYVRDAGRFLGGEEAGRRVSQLAQRDVERCMWHHGFEDVYWSAARVTPPRDPTDQRWPPGRVISKAVRKTSKPYLALAAAEACADRGLDSMPPILRNVIETSVVMAREAIDGRAGAPVE